MENKKHSGAPNENIVQNHLNILLLNVFSSSEQIVLGAPEH